MVKEQMKVLLHQKREQKKVVILKLNGIWRNGEGRITETEQWGHPSFRRMRVYCKSTIHL